MARSLPTIPLRRIARSPLVAWGVAVVAVAIAITFAVLWRTERAEDQRRAEVARTARELLVALTNFESETIETDVGEIRSYAVGDFASEVVETFDAERLEALREGGVRSIGEVRSVFVQELEDSTATVFGVVDETTTNERTTVPRRDVLRVELELIETAEGWRVSGVQILRTPEETTPP